MDTQMTDGLISVQFEYTDRRLLDAGTLICRIKAAHASVELRAIKTQPFAPLEDLVPFLESIVQDDLPSQTYWDEEDLQNEFHAQPMNTSGVFLFRLFTAAAFDSEHEGHDHEEDEPPAAIEGIFDKKQFVSAFADALLEVCQNAADLAKEWKIDANRVAALKGQITNLQERNA
ncbi:MAG: hypothetical protein HY327_04085 [Chloroflexi bacterium]|nr:hypothetical protein [Chloroflexota bacterium]